MIKSPLHKYSIQRLESLSASLKEGSLQYGLSDGVLKQILGTDFKEVRNYLEELVAADFSSTQISSLIESIIHAKADDVEIEDMFELVLSGPQVPGIPINDTSATMHSIIESAENELLLVGYAIHNAQLLFEHIHNKMISNKDLEVTFCLNINRDIGDNSLDTQIITRFVEEFKHKYWTWKEIPKIYYDPRSLKRENFIHSSLHAKCIIADCSNALITSANFTKAAQERNIELGILIRYKPMIERIRNYFEGLKANRFLVTANFDSL